MPSKMDIKLLTFLHFLLAGATAAIITVANSCRSTVWPATSTNTGSPHPPTRFLGFELPSQASQAFDIPPGWSGRMWPRTHCAATSSGAWTCQTGDCRTGIVHCGAMPMPPVTYVDLNLGAVGSGINDSYQVSVAAGFNVPVSVVPSAGYGCSAASCPTDVNAVCPAALRVVGDGGGGVMACMSACQALHDEADCCEGKYRGPDNCRPTNYTGVFKRACPLAMSFAYESAFFYCDVRANYLVTFCPN